jgi:hypothetical protein
MVTIEENKKWFLVHNFGWGSCLILGQSYSQSYSSIGTRTAVYDIDHVAAVVSIVRGFPCDASDVIYALLSTETVR